VIDAVTAAWSNTSGGARRHRRRTPPFENKGKGKNMSNEKIERTLGRQLARELTEQELAVVSGGFASSESETATDLTDHTPTGNPCSDCD
jgi:hypothetical protein